MKTKDALHLKTFYPFMEDLILKTMLPQKFRVKQGLS